MTVCANRAGLRAKVHFKMTLPFSQTAIAAVCYARSHCNSCQVEAIPRHYYAMQKRVYTLVSKDQAVLPIHCRPGH